MITEREVQRENIRFLQGVVKRFKRNRVPSADAEAETLIRSLGRLNRLDFFTGRRPLSPWVRNRIARALAARRRGIPLAYLLKRADFFGRSFLVSRDTLIPRPETELLVEEVLKIMAERLRAPVRPSVLDLGTGTGCIAVSLALLNPRCRMTALDVCPKALGIARQNARRHGVEDKIRFLKGDLFSTLNSKLSTFNFIVTNPPYVSEEEIPSLPQEVHSEPLLAIDGGRRGLEVILRILQEAPSFLKRGGFLLMEIGEGQSRTVADKLIKEALFENFRFVKDLAGIDRILVAWIS